MDEEHPLVRVQWRDTTTYGDRANLELVKQAQTTIATTVGMLLHKDKSNIIVGHNQWGIINSCPIYSEFTIIPLGCVVAITQLSAVK